MLRRLLRRISHSDRPGVVHPRNADDGGSGPTLKQKGDAALKAGDAARAEAHYREAVAFDPRDSRSHFLLGYTLNVQGRIDEALSALEAALSIDPDLFDAHYLMGSIHEAQGRTSAAIRHFEKVLESDPAHAFAVRDLALAYARSGKTDAAAGIVVRGLASRPEVAEFHLLDGNLKAAGQKPEAAIACFQRALALDPALAEAHYSCGLALQGLGRSSKALGCYDAALGIRPDYLEALAARAKLLSELRRFDEALAGFESLTRLNPGSAEFHFEHGSVLLALNRPAEALNCFDRVIAIAPGVANAHSSRALTLMALDRPDEALASTDRALSLAPDFAAAQLSRVTLLLQLGRHAAALVECDRALSGNPQQPSLLNCRGFALQELGRSEEALSAFDSALKLKPQFPEALTNRSATLLHLNRFDEALDDLERAQALAPALADVHFARGNVLQELTRHAEALQCFARALELRPDFEEAHLHQGSSHLALGDFETGWRKYEHRWKCVGWRASQGIEVDRAFRAPLWLGQESVARKTILLHAEQGFGDTIQFSRYVAHLAHLGALVLLEVQPPLKELLRDLQGVQEVYAKGESLPAYDLHCPLLSLPLACKTRVDSIPLPGGYLGRSIRHAAKVKQWRERLGPPKARMRVGLAWSGNASHRNDSNRSIRFSEFAGLLSEDIEFCCLQNDLREADREAALNHGRIRFFFENMEDFSETAGLVGNMDLVICVDTSLAHLAGALGRPVWLLLPANPDSRWMLEREDSPWYDSMRLIRQRRLGSWADAIETLRGRLDRQP